MWIQVWTYWWGGVAKTISTLAGNRQTDNFIQEERNDLIWDRGHVHDKYLPKLDKDNVFIVHGHTPIPLLKRKLMDYEPFEPGAYYYYNDHKICIDNGVFATGYICLFDLDTFDEHIFQVDVEE